MLEQAFQELKDKWEEETRVLSSSTAIAENEHYQQIIALGIEVIPSILIDLAATHNQWFNALMQITGENPVPEEYYGNISRMAEIWTNWGYANGYLLKK